MDRDRIIIAALLAVWLVCAGLSVSAVMAEPTGDGFVRGLNRVTGFLGWQLAAALVALPLWLTSRRLPKDTALRWIARIPGWWAALLLALLVTFIAAGVISSYVGSPPDDQAPGPVTAPVD